MEHMSRIAYAIANAKCTMHVYMHLCSVSNKFCSYNVVECGCINYLLSCSFAVLVLIEMNLNATARITP